jgi:hypothetical protein
VKVNEARLKRYSNRFGVLKMAPGGTPSFFLYSTSSSRVNVLIKYVGNRNCELVLKPFKLLWMTSEFTPDKEFVIVKLVDVVERVRLKSP